MQLNELQVGQRFQFESWHHGKTFEITKKQAHEITFVDIATGDERTTKSNRRTFRMDVYIENGPADKVFSDEEIIILKDLVHDAYKLSAERGETEDKRSLLNRIYLKLIK